MVLSQAQANHERSVAGSAPLENQQHLDQEAPPPYSAHPAPALYPSLSEYMGLPITPQLMQEMQVVTSEVNMGYVIYSSENH